MIADTLYTRDTTMLLEQFKNTLALMHNTMIQMQPIVENQMQVIQLQRFLANSLLLSGLVLFCVVLIFILKKEQCVRKISEIHFPLKSIIILIAFWMISLAVFNFVPGVLLLNVKKNQEALATIEKSKERLFPKQQ